MIRTIFLAALAIWLMIHFLAFVAIVIIVIMEDCVYGNNRDK